MTSQPALQKDMLLERARERYKRTQRLSWSIQTCEDQQKHIGTMVQLLKDALLVTTTELDDIELMLGYKLRDKERH